MKLSHIIYSVFKKCQFTGRLEYIFLLLITYLVFLQYRCLFLRWYTVCTVSGSVKAARSDIKATDLPATAPCKLNTCSAVEERSCGHTGQNSRKKISFKIEQSAAELWRLGKYFQEGELSISTPQRGSTKLHQIWGEQSSIIAAPNRLLWYRRVASFRNDGGSENSGIEIVAKFYTFCSLSKNYGRGVGECWAGWSSRPYGRTCGMHLTGGRCAL